MPEDTHEDIRQRLFDAAWNVPAFTPAPQRTVVRARRRATLTISGAVTAIVAAAVAIVLATSSVPLIKGDRTAIDPAGDPREYLVNVTAGETTAFTGLPRGAWLFDISRDASRLAFEAETEGRNQVWIVNMDGTGLRQLTHDPYEATDPAWSPDGTKIVYVGFGGGDSRDLFVIDVAGGHPDKVMSEPEDPSNPRWSPDASRILYWSWVDTDDPSEVSTSTTSVEVRSVRVETGRVSVLAGGGAHTGAWEGAWAERSARIAFITARFTTGSGDADHALWAMDGDGSRLARTGRWRLARALPGSTMKRCWCKSSSQETDPPIRAGKPAVSAFGIEAAFAGRRRARKSPECREARFLKRDRASAFSPRSGRGA